METVKAFAVVAHPDDCLIFARCYIDHYPKLDWTIVYLTYSSDDERAREVSSYWNKRSIPTVFLGFFDNIKDLETQEFNFWDKNLAIESLIATCTGAEQILTHNQDGEYGHIHHKLVHEAMQLIDVPKIYFGSQNSDLELESKFALNLDDFPIHREVLEMFDLNKSNYNFEKKK